MVDGGSISRTQADTCWKSLRDPMAAAAGSPSRRRGANRGATQTTAGLIAHQPLPVGTPSLLNMLRGRKHLLVAGNSRLLQQNLPNADTGSFVTV